MSLWHEKNLETIECTKTSKGKLKALIDENELDNKLIKELKKMFNIKMAIKNKGLDDKNIIQQAIKEDRVIITNDHHFYDDNKFPLNRYPGIMIIGKDVDKTIISLEKLFGTFDKNGYGYNICCNSWWFGKKIKVLEKEFVYKDIFDPEDRFPYEI